MMFVEFPILETENFILQAVTPELYKRLLESYSDSDIMQFLGLENEQALLAEKEKYKNGISTFKISFIYFQIRRKDGEWIGDCGFHTWYTKHRRAEIGYSLRKEENRGKGYMSEILPALLKYGFETMDLNRIEAFTATENPASQKLLLKNGFLKEGVMRGHYVVDIIPEDSVAYALLKKDWLKFNSNK